MEEMLKIFLNNPYQDAVQANSIGFLNNTSFTPTVEEINRTLSPRGDSFQAVSESDEPFFGTHIREAATTVKKLLAR
jgi:hypothetical protein